MRYVVVVILALVLGTACEDGSDPVPMTRQEACQIVRSQACTELVRCASPDFDCGDGTGVVSFAECMACLDLAGDCASLAYPTRPIEPWEQTSLDDCLAWLTSAPCYEIAYGPWTGECYAF
jgi:hypothetical protein